MLRKIAAIILLFAFAAQAFNGAAIVVGYYTNSAAFAKNCENKARPTLHCNGKCQMMKKLNEQEKKEKQGPERKEVNQNEAISFLCYFEGPISAISNISRSFPPVYTSSVSKGSLPDILHPPSLA